MIWRGEIAASESFELHEVLHGRIGELRKTLNGGRHWLRRLVAGRLALARRRLTLSTGIALRISLRLKIEITRRLLGDAGKDRPGDQPAVIQLRFARVRIIQHHQTDKLRMSAGR